MTEEQLEHLIRASGAITGDDAVIVVGSQSILPWLKKWSGKPPRAWPGIFTLSTEADIIPIDNDAWKSDLVDGSIGEDSLFHSSFGYYAQGVSMDTAKAPEGWLSRCYPLANQNTRQIVGHCMHPVDLFIAKSVANRPKDGPFLDAMIEQKLVNEKTVLHLAGKVPGMSPEEAELLRSRITGRFQRLLRLTEQGPGPTSVPHTPIVHQAALQVASRPGARYILHLHAESGTLQGAIRLEDGDKIRAQESGLPVRMAADGKRLVIAGSRLSATVHKDTRRVAFQDAGVAVPGVMAPRLQPNGPAQGPSEDPTEQVLQRLFGGKDRGIGL